MKMIHLSPRLPQILGVGLLLGAIVVGCGGGGGGSSSSTTGSTTATTGSTTATTGSTTATTGSTTATTGSTTSTTGSTTSTTGSTTSTTGSTTSTTGSTTSTTGSTTSTTGSTTSTTGSTTSTTGSTTSTTGSTTSTTGSTTSTTSGSNGNISSLDFSSGFPQDPTVYSSYLVVNTKTDQPTITGQPAKQATSIFSRHELAPISTFHTTFTFKIDAGASNGDGITFCVQGLSSTALGGSGGLLGYGNISNSVAVKYDTHQNAGDPSGNCTSLVVNGNAPYGGLDLTPSGIDLHSGDVFKADLSYTHGTLTSTITDMQTHATNTQVYQVNIPQVVGGNAAHVGFTSAQDFGTAPQTIETWVISSP